MIQAGSSPETISFALGLKLEVVQQVLANDRLIAKSGSNESNPTYIYSYNQEEPYLLRTHLVTGEQSLIKVPAFTFSGRIRCCWSELLGGRLLITGGGCPETNLVVKIETLREFAASQQPPMLTPRGFQACVYHAQFLYVLGGNSSQGWLSECERFVCAESRWEALPPLPSAACNISGVVVEGSLYALGGYNGYDPEVGLASPDLGMPGVETPPSRQQHTLLQAQQL
jgi:hypothetical protein